MAKRSAKARKAATASKTPAIVTAAEVAGRTVGRAVRVTMTAMEAVKRAARRQRPGTKVKKTAKPKKTAKSK